MDFIETEFKGCWSDYFRTFGFGVHTILPKFYESRTKHAVRISDVLNQYDVVLLNDSPYAQASLGLLGNEIVVIPILHLGIDSFVRNASGNSPNWDVIVAVSPELENIAKQRGRDLGAVTCIFNGVSVPSSWPKINIPQVLNRALRVIFLGRLEDRQKGIMLLPKILMSLKKKQCPVVLSIVGDGPDKNKLLEVFRELPDLNVTFYGALTHDLSLETLDAQDVLIMPSYFEGMPIALLEAMAKGVVPVVSNLPGSVDFIIKHRESGYLVNVGDTEAFAEAINELEADRRRLREMSESCWQTVLKYFSAARMCDAYLELIDDLRRKKNEALVRRYKLIDKSLLGDLNYLPVSAVRPVRKLLKIIGIWNLLKSKELV